MHIIFGLSWRTEYTHLILSFCSPAKTTVKRKKHKTTYWKPKSREESRNWLRRMKKTQSVEKFIPGLYLQGPQIAHKLAAQGRRLENTSLESLINPTGKTLRSWHQKFSSTAHLPHYTVNLKVNISLTHGVRDSNQLLVPNF